MLNDHYRLWFRSGDTEHFQPAFLSEQCRQRFHEQAGAFMQTPPSNAEASWHDQIAFGRRGLGEHLLAEVTYNVRLWCLGNEMDGPWQVGRKTASISPARQASAGEKCPVTHKI
jgi:hypothetical protein